MKNRCLIDADNENDWKLSKHTNDNINIGTEIAS